jgi:hypothetical protein
MKTNSVNQKGFSTKVQADALEVLCKKLECKDMEQLFSKLIEAGELLVRLKKRNMDLYAVKKEEVEVIPEPNGGNSVILHVQDKKDLHNLTQEIEDLLEMQESIPLKPNLFIPLGDA